MPRRQTAGTISRRRPERFAATRESVRSRSLVETRRSFDEQQQEVRSEVVKLAARSCEPIGAATHALLDADLSLVERIYANHRDIEGFVPRVEQQVYQLFALQQPMASDLRTLL